MSIRRKREGPCAGYFVAHLHELSDGERAARQDQENPATQFHNDTSGKATTPDGDGRQARRFHQMAKRAFSFEQIILSY
jgi:hypothetical protein